MVILSGFLLVLLVISAVFLIVIVLMQDEQGEGMGGIFGGGGAAPVGNRSGNILTRATAVLATVFLVTLFGYAWINRTPDASNVEAAARQLQGDGTVEWWRTDRPVDLPEATLDAPVLDESTDSAPSSDQSSGS